MVKNSTILSNDTDVANSLNNFFQNTVKSLELNENKFLLTDTEDLDDPVDIAIKKFETHPSILNIKENIESSMFSFNEVDLSDIEMELKNLNSKKASTFKNITSKQLKQTADICSESLLNIWNDEIVKNNRFPSKLKYADITPIFKKGDASLEKNYRPVSVLPVVSKVFERIMHKQISNHIETHLSPYMCGYRKGFSTQHALIALIEKWKVSLDNKGFAGAILMDLSKAFDTINHELLIAKLHAYGFNRNALMIIMDYLSDRWHRTRINTACSSWLLLLSGVPQGSVLGPLLFNIFINDLFLIFHQTNTCNFADDTTLYACDTNLKNMLQRLEHDSILAIDWFECNYMKLNEDKCHLLIPGKNIEHMWAKVGDSLIWESAKENLLGVTLDKNLNFKEHISNICLKVGRKISALNRLTKYMNFIKRRTLFKAFIESQFAYCPLIWMFHSRELNNKINRLHKRALRIVYQDNDLSFEELLQKDNSVSIHHRNIQLVAIELFKVRNNLSPEIVRDIYKEKNGTSLRSNVTFSKPRVNSVYKGKDSLRYFGPVVWDMLPKEYKSAKSLSIFKKQIKNWKPSNCTCRLCMNFVQGVGYLKVH